MSRVWHITTRRRAEAILRDGFKAAMTPRGPGLSFSVDVGAAKALLRAAQRMFSFRTKADVVDWFEKMGTPRAEAEREAEYYDARMAKRPDQAWRDNPGGLYLSMMSGLHPSVGGSAHRIPRNEFLWADIGKNLLRSGEHEVVAIPVTSNHPDDPPQFPPGAVEAEWWVPARDLGMFEPEGIETDPRDLDSWGLVEADAFLYVENDPGVPLGEWADPLAGLEEPQAALLESLTEGKAVGTSFLGGDVAERDRRLRPQIRANVRYHVKQAGVNAMRDMKPVIREARKDIGDLLRGYLAGTVSYKQLQEDSAGHWMIAYSKIRDIGRKASAVERFTPAPQTLAEEERWFRGAVREELGYWQLFMEEVQRRKGRESFDEARVWQRFENYVKALRFMYESARIVSLPPQVLLYWMGPKPNDPKQKGRICPGCVYMMERSPFTKATIPAVPRDGSTSCLTNCRHRVVMRVAHPIDVQKREQTLPKRKMMVESLKRIQEADHGPGRKERARNLAKRLARQRPKAQNPFRGKRMPKNPTVPPAGVMPPLADERQRSRTARNRFGLTEGVLVDPGTLNPGAASAFFIELNQDFDRRGEPPYLTWFLPDGTERGAVLFGRDRTLREAERIAAKFSRRFGIPVVRGYKGERPSVAEAYLSGVQPRSILEQFHPESSAHKTIDLYYIAKMLATAAKERPLNVPYLRGLLDRLVAALELTVLGVRGRPAAMRFSDLLRGALEDLWDALEEAGVSSESTEVIGAMIGEGV